MAVEETKAVVPDPATAAAVHEALNTTPTGGVPEGSTGEVESTVPGEAEASASSDFWSAFAEDADELDAAVAPPAAAKAPEPVVPEVATPEEKKEASQPEVQVEVPVSPVVEQAPVQPTAVEAPAPAPAAPEVPSQTTGEVPAQQQPVGYTQEQIAEMRKNALEGLEKEYALSEADAQNFALEPEKVFPKLAAKIQLQAYEQAVQTVMQQVPQVVQAVVSQINAVRDVNTAFYGKWPKLKGQEALVKRVAQVYGQINPQAEREKAIMDIGRQVSAMLGIPLEETPTVPPPAAAPPPPTPAPTAATRSAPRAPTNPFAAMAEEFLREDQE